MIIDRPLIMRLTPQACDKGMFRDCQDGCEAERAHGGHGQDGCEAEREQGEGVAMADRTAISTAISTRICSQLKRVRSFDGDSDGDSDVDHDLQDLNLLSKSVFKHPARPQSSRGGSSLRRSSPGSHPDTSAPPILISTPNLGRGLGPGTGSSRVSRMSRGCSEDTSTIRAQSEHGSSIVFRAHSLRSSALSRLETRCADDTSTAGSSTALHATLRALRPSPRPDGSTYGIHGYSPLGMRAGDSIPGDSGDSPRSRSRNLLSRSGSHGSLSSFGGSQSGRISSFANRLETPPGAPNALEAHKLLVACPAPRRPAVYAVDRKCTARLRVPPHLDTFSTEAF